MTKSKIKISTKVTPIWLYEEQYNDLDTLFKMSGKSKSQIIRDLIGQNIKIRIERKKEAAFKEIKRKIDNSKEGAQPTDVIDAEQCVMADKRKRLAYIKKHFENNDIL